MSLRNSVFTLCNQIKPIDELAPLRKLIHDLHVIQEGQNNIDRTDFGCLSRHGHNQFYGYLFTNEHIEEYKKSTIFKGLTPLNTEEQQLLERGQATINLFIDRCLAELIEKYPNMHRALNPYFKFKPIKKPAAQPYIKNSALDECIAAFKNIPAYKELVASPIAEVLRGTSEMDYMRLTAMMSKEIADKSPGDISEDMKNLLLRYDYSTKDPGMLLFRSSCLMLSIKETLKVVCQLLFTALLGGDLIVLNNDNIINIESNESNVINRYMTVLTQEIAPVQLYDTMGAILLIDCDPGDDYHIHEFGQIHAETFSFNHETGSTTKFTFVILDEYLNPLHNLIK